MTEAETYRLQAAELRRREQRIRAAREAAADAIAAGTAKPCGWRGCLLATPIDSKDGYCLTHRLARML